MSIALKHIKERRFIKNANDKPKSSSDNFAFLPEPHSFQNKTDDQEKRPSQIVYTKRLDDEPTQTSDLEEASLINQTKAKNVQTAKNLDAETLNYWEMVFKDTPTLNENDLISILLNIEKLEANPKNNTIMLNKVFKDEYNGYIKQTSIYSHVWELCKY